MRTADFHYHLPPELIAQQPAPNRDRSRLLVVHRADHRTEHSKFQDIIKFFQPGDVLVLNNSRVIPARLHGQNSKTGGQFEILLLEENAVNDWWAMMRPGKRAKIGSEIQLTDRAGGATDFHAEVMELNQEDTVYSNFPAHPIYSSNWTGWVKCHSRPTLSATASNPATGNATKPCTQNQQVRWPRRRRFAFYHRVAR